jgi:hypothetical protein
MRIGYSLNMHTTAASAAMGSAFAPAAAIAVQFDVRPNDGGARQE